MPRLSLVPEWSKENEIIERMESEKDKKILAHFFPQLRHGTSFMFVKGASLNDNVRSEEIVRAQSIMFLTDPTQFYTCDDTARDNNCMA